ncbi:NFX1-type zinc finger-containing protein 1-like protein, partial [Aphelenchoides avenae]
MERVLKTWPGCEHEIETFCSDDETKMPCPKPCEAKIPGCLHECKGTCGQCRNGRLHLQCTQDCGRPLPCAHICEGKCAKACPPCPKPCETACGHSQCCQAGAVDGNAKPLRKVDHEDTRKQLGRRCGDACPPCVEDCLIQCQHRKCTRLCYEPCDVDPCQEPCTKKLECSPKVEGAEPHLCIGIYFGNEEEPEARFVQLKDCGHYVEASSLDRWVRQTVEDIEKATQSREIITISCPKCTTPIRHSKRYVRILNQRAADIEMVKRKKRGSDQATLVGEWNQIKQILRRLVCEYQTSVEPAARKA